MRYIISNIKYKKYTIIHMASAKVDQRALTVTVSTSSLYNLSAHLTVTSAAESLVRSKSHSESRNIKVPFLNYTSYQIAYPQTQ